MEYTYERASNHILKKQLFSWEYRVYILKGFKSHIKKTQFFSYEHKVYI
jgi:hypothetical protein